MKHNLFLHTETRKCFKMFWQLHSCPQTFLHTNFSYREVCRRKQIQNCSAGLTFRISTSKLFCRQTFTTSSPRKVKSEKFASGTEAQSTTHENSKMFDRFQSTPLALTNFLRVKVVKVSHCQTFLRTKYSRPMNSKVVGGEKVTKFVVETKLKLKLYSANLIFELFRF